MKPHVPTLMSTLVIVVIIFFLLHWFAHRK